MRGAASFERRSRGLALRPRILIVCEGAKTEHLYFDDVRTAFKLGGIEIAPPEVSGGTDPLTLVNYGVSRRKDFDDVYCVFDCDQHLNINDAVQRAEAKGVHIVFSNPCFELWFILHSRYTTRQMTAHEAYSHCCDLHSDYAKNRRIYAALKDRLEDALANAGRLREHDARVNGGRKLNPYTDVDLLMQVLRAARRP